MNDAQKPGHEPHQVATISPKLRAALDYLGDKLSTHRASRFKPTRHFLLNEWVMMRRVATPRASLLRLNGAGEAGQTGLTRFERVAASCSAGTVRESSMG
jgi:hypothetical protein